VENWDFGETKKAKNEKFGKNERILGFFVVTLGAFYKVFQIFLQKTFSKIEMGVFFRVC
jgi:hypothetical protein